MNDKDLKILFLLAENERAAARLYRCFEAKSKEHREFWKSLVEDELQHADWIEKLEPGVEEGEVKIEKHKFPLEALKGSIETINEISKRAEMNESSLSEYSEQLEIAHELEKSMIEKEFFKSIESDDDLIRELLKKLQSATEDHQEKVLSEWKKNI